MRTSTLWLRRRTGPPPAFVPGFQEAVIMAPRIIQYPKDRLNPATIDTGGQTPSVLLKARLNVRCTKLNEDLQLQKAEEQLWDSENLSVALASQVAHMSKHHTPCQVVI